MRKVINFLKDNEQIITFLTTIIYLSLFMIIFDNEMKNEWGYSLGWIIQFFLLSGWNGYRMRQKNWKLPKDIKDTHSW